MALMKKQLEEKERALQEGMLQFITALFLHDFTQILTNRKGPARHTEPEHSYLHLDLHSSYYVIFNTLSEEIRTKNILWVLILKRLTVPHSRPHFLTLSSKAGNN